MDKIKFRGFGISDKKWHYGLLTICPNGKYIIGGFEVYHKSVGQYTGLEDKKGREIYKGDVFKSANKTFEIIFSDGGFCAKQVNCNYYDFLIKFMPLEIIGNIHTSPELLKVR